jgi:glutaredoxin-like YruB-family protein
MKNIKVYVSNSCPYCHMVKEFMNDQGYEYEERNITTDPSAREELIKMNMRGVPVTIVDGERIVGYDPQKIKATIDA